MYVYIMYEPIYIYTHVYLCLYMSIYIYIQFSIWHVVLVQDGPSIKKINWFESPRTSWMTILGMDITLLGGGSFETSATLSHHTSASKLRDHTPPWSFAQPEPQRPFSAQCLSHLEKNWNHQPDLQYPMGCPSRSSAKDPLKARLSVKPDALFAVSQIPWYPVWWCL